MNQLKKLQPAERHELLKAVCSLAWADGHISSQEIERITDLFFKLKLSDEEMKEVSGWLKAPPTQPVNLDDEHFKMFADTLKAVAGSDGISAEEAAWFQNLKRN